MQTLITELIRDYNNIKSRIEERLADFQSIWQNASDTEILYELVFCILTPQSKPDLCWEAVQRLKDNDFLSMNSDKEILEHLYGVRFKYKKSEFVREARDFCLCLNKGLKQTLSAQGDIYTARQWLVNHIKGIGIKEAGHFLRNIGRGEELAILDRHVLRFLLSAEVITQIPSSLSNSRYLEIEKKMQTYAKQIEIGMGPLDFLLFYRATGKIFK